jgi:hypothetical protein
LQKYFRNQIAVASYLTTNRPGQEHHKKATKVDVAYNAWQTAATENALRQDAGAPVTAFSSRDAIE